MWRVRGAVSVDSKGWCVCVWTVRGGVSVDNEGLL